MGVYGHAFDLEVMMGVEGEVVVGELDKECVDGRVWAESGFSGDNFYFRATLGVKEVLQSSKFFTLIF